MFWFSALPRPPFDIGQLIYLNPGARRFDDNRPYVVLDIRRSIVDMFPFEGWTVEIRACGELHSEAEYFPSSWLTDEEPKEMDYPDAFTMTGRPLYIHKGGRA